MGRYSFERLHDLELRCLVEGTYTSLQHYVDHCDKRDKLQDYVKWLEVQVSSWYGEGAA